MSNLKFIQHDISHCNYDQCELKDTCYRYQAHLDAIEKKLDYLTYLVVNDKYVGGLNCTAYWGPTTINEKNLQVKEEFSNNICTKCQFYKTCTQSLIQFNICAAKHGYLKKLEEALKEQ